MSNLHHFRCENALWQDFTKTCSTLGITNSAALRRYMREVAYNDSTGEPKNAEE